MRNTLIEAARSGRPPTYWRATLYFFAVLGLPLFVAIIVTIIVMVGLWAGRDSAADWAYKDSKLLLKYCLGGENACRTDVLTGLSKLHERLLAQGREVVYYGDNVDLKDRYAVVMHWKLPNGKYGVILGDLTAKTVTPELLIMLQARMLEERAK